MTHEYRYRGTRLCWLIEKSAQEAIATEESPDDVARLVASSKAQDAYTPKENSAIARKLPDDAPEGHKIQSIGEHQPSESIKSAAGIALRMVYIMSDTTLSMKSVPKDYFGNPDWNKPHQVEDSLWELRGNGLYVFNSLLSDSEPRQAREIMDYGSGFLNGETRQKRNMYFIRAIEALDSMSQETTGQNLVLRSAYGSGPNRMYSPMPDLGWADLRDRP